MSSNKVDKITGELVTLASGSRMWIGTKAAHDAAVQAGTMPNNCLLAILDDWQDSTVDVVEEDNMHPVTSNATYVRTEEIEDEISDIVNVYGAKNLCPTMNPSDPLTYATWSNYFTINADGSVTANGTPSSRMSIASRVILPAGEYIMNGCPSGGEYNKYRIMFLKYTPSEAVVYADSGSTPSTVTLDEETEVIIRVDLYANYTASNLVYKPMICLKSAYDLDPSYVPYAKTNKELTEDVAVKLGGTLTANTTYIDTADLHYEQFGKVTHVFGNFTTKTAIASSDALVQLFSNLPKSSGGMNGTSSAYTLCLIHDNANNYRCFVSKDGELVSRYKDIPIGTYYADFTYISA